MSKYPDCPIGEGLTLIYEFHKAPEQLQIMCYGGDVDYVVIASKDTNIPCKVEELGVCSNTHFYVDGEGNVEEDVGHMGPRSDLKCPAYPNCHIIISTHS